MRLLDPRAVFRMHTPQHVTGFTVRQQKHSRPHLLRAANLGNTPVCTDPSTKVEGPLPPGHSNAHPHSQLDGNTPLPFKATPRSWNHSPVQDNMAQVQASVGRWQLLAGMYDAATRGSVTTVGLLCHGEELSGV